MFTVKKKIAGMIGMVLILALLPMASFAATNNSIKEGGIITPYWMGVITVYSDLICASGKANPVFDVAVDPTKVDKVNFNGSLLQYKNAQWVTIATWNVNKSVYLGHSLFDQTYSISSGYNYKFVTVIKAYKGSTLVDTINVNSTEKYY